MLQNLESTVTMAVASRKMQTRTEIIKFMKIRYMVVEFQIYRFLCFKYSVWKQWSSGAILKTETRKLIEVTIFK